MRGAGAGAGGRARGLDDGLDDSLDGGLDDAVDDGLETSVDDPRAVGPVSGVITAIHLLKGTEIGVLSGWLMLYTS
jgi:hypothetical protein